MVAETTTSLTNFLNDLLTPIVESFPERTVLSDELRRNKKRSNFNNDQVRVRLLSAPKQGTGAQAQTGTLNVARQLDDKAAYIKMGRVSHPIEVSRDLIMAIRSRDFSSAGDGLKLEMEQASTALSRVENEFLNGTGDALLAAVTTAGTNTTTVLVGAAANFYQLYAGRIVDILTRSNGATVSLARTISSTTSTSVVVDTAVTTSTVDGIYIEGSYGNAIQGIRQPQATTGTFQGVDLATNVFFRAIDGRGTTAAADLSMSIMDGMYRRVVQNSGKAPDFWIGDPATIDKFGQGLVSQFRWMPKISRLATGWEGIDYRGTPLIPEFDQPVGSLTGVNKSAVTIYGYSDGPEWDDETGSRFQRFTRAHPVEAWLVDFLQLGFHQPNATVYTSGLNQAT